MFVQIPGHPREPYGFPRCFALIVVSKPHLIQKMCFETPMCTPTVHTSDPTKYPPYIWYPVFCLQYTGHDLFVVTTPEYPWQQHCYFANNICKQFCNHHNNYYITMGNGTFKRTFQLDLDPDKPS